MLQFSGYDFEFIAEIAPSRNLQGELEEFLPQSRFRDAAIAKLHAYGAGPFCKFSVAQGNRRSGLYIITVDSAPVYVGECQDLFSRFGSNGYGGISPRNCFEGGQPTNCRINALILTVAKSQQLIELWFHHLNGGKAERLSLEARLIENLKPVWNRTRGAPLLTGR